MILTPNELLVLSSILSAFAALSAIVITGRE